ncbi:MAG: DegQ family serine endoprotease [Rhodospirillales bacterium]|nr:DegQ family serine endoprotease [Rhodospirillales bacterium]
MKKKSFPAALLSLLLVMVCIPFGPAHATQNASSTPDSREQITLSFAPLVKKIAPAVVSISSKRVITTRTQNPFLDDPFFAPFFLDGAIPGFRGLPRQKVESALGSGVIIAPDGLIVTNAHVVREADEITVTLNDGREFPARVSVSDTPSDIALVRIDAQNKPLPYAPLESSESLEIGDLVIAIGNPFGVGQTVTSGIVSARSRPNLEINDYNFFIQTDAAINPGNSGGPLVDMKGGVVGINTAIYSRDGGSLGIGFAIPSEMVQTVIAAEKQGGKAGEQTDTGRVARAWLGAQMQSLTADIATSLGLDRPQGALVSHIRKDSPAARSGLKVGDVVLSVSGHAIRDPAEMHFRWATIPVGESTVFEIWRKGKNLSLNVSAELPPDTPPREETALKGRHALSGATIANINPAVSIEMNLPDDAAGVIVMDTANGSPAARLVTKGDLIVSIDGRKVKNVADVKKRVSALRGYAISLVINRNGQMRQILIR